MSMTYYQNYLDKVSKTPNDGYRGFTDAFIKTQWQDTTLLSTVQEETVNGSFIFNPIDVWKNTVAEFASRIIKSEKDFRRLMFQDVDHQIGRGRYYLFGENYWLVYEPTNEEEPYSEVLVRRCNNVAKWIDVETGKIVEQPCVLEYDLTATNPKVNKDVIQANGSTTLVLQGNEWTKRLRRNQRFIFNSIPYKFIAYNNYMQETYPNGDVPLYFIDVDFDVEKPTDDLVNNIADRYLYNFEVVINENPSQQIQGFNGKLTANVTLNGEDTDGQVVWSSNANGVIDVNGNYILTGLVGSVATFTATFGSFISSVSIEIVNAIVNRDEIVINPIIDELYQGNSMNFTAYVYKNGVQQSDSISYTTIGADNSCYILKQTGNSFTLTNLKYSSVPLTINLESSTIVKSIQINLRALF